MSNNGPLKDTKKTQEHDATLGIDVKKQMVGIAQKMKTTEEASYYPPKELIEACGGDAEIARAIFCSDQQKQIRNNEQKQIQDN